MSGFPLSFIDLDSRGEDDLQIFRVLKLLRTWSRVLRLIKVLKLNQLVQDMQNTNEVNPTYFKLIKALLYSGIVCHVFSCGWCVRTCSPKA